MPLDPDRLQKPLRKLKKSLQCVPADPTPKAIHDLRTRTRRVEAILQALKLDREPPGAKLLKAIAPVRKAAGKVRDMDVLTGYTVTLPSDDEEHCLVQLVEALGSKRAHAVRKLVRVITRQSKQARRPLKRSSALIEKHIGAPGRTSALAAPWQSDAMVVALDLSATLAKYPELNRRNLHAYRLQVKQLRYILDLSQQSDSALLEALANTKDAIGAWHDWSELAALAAKVLRRHKDCALLKQIQDSADRHFSRALALANQVRSRYFGSIPAPRSSKKPPQPTRLKPPVLITAARLGA